MERDGGTEDVPTDTGAGSRWYVSTVVSTLRSLPLTSWLAAKVIGLG